MTVDKEASDVDVGYVFLQRFSSIGHVSLINHISILQSTSSALRNPQALMIF